MLVTVRRSGKSMSFSVRRQNAVTQFIGLMFSTKRTDMRLFSYNKEKIVPIHSWFVFYPFLIAWLDSENRIIEFRVVKPFNSLVIPNKKSKAFIEIPIDAKYSKEIRFIVGNRQRFKYN